MQNGNIRQLPGPFTSASTKFTAQSGDEGSCELIILASSYSDPGIGISQITSDTDPTGDDAVFKSALNNQKYFSVL